ncbi:MAG: restriction endonuclease [Deltaproteobacteria bacterium]|nr:restriction endonuclease [Deltaproteobacteria bacterium]
MPIPTYEDAMLPVMKTLADGEPRHRRALSDMMADHFNLTADEREKLLPSGNAPVIRSRTGWALSYLKQAAVVTSPRRGWYALTDRGQKILTSNPPRVDSKFLEQFPEFMEFRARSKPESDDEAVSVASRAGESSTLGIAPDEALEEAYARLRAELETELLDMVRTTTPRFFEQLVIDLLVRMGYGGSREEAARAVGRSGDGGIDGVIDEDRLGLDVIYVQAKRWENSVGRPEIQKFAGALQGQRAKKGIFITTSHFTKDAEEYAQRIESRIVLIDGRRLAALMFDADVGVSTRGLYTVKSIDGDYFDET